MDQQLQNNNVGEGWAALEAEKQQLQAGWAQLNLERAEFEKERKESGIEYKLFMGNLDDTSTEEDIRAYTQGYGAIKEIVMLKDHTGKSKRSCFVKYFSKAAADACLNALNGKVRDKNSTQDMAVKYANPKIPNHSGGGFSSAPASLPAFHTYAPPSFPPSSFGGQSAYNPSSSSSYAPYPSAPAPVPHSPRSFSQSSSSGFGRGPPGANLYVNNLAPMSSESDVQAMFAEFGTVLSVKVFSQHCYGFVSFDNAQAAANAIASLHGIGGDAMGNRRLEVSLKKEGSNRNRFSPY